MTCRELADFMVDYLSGELPEASRTEFERHLRVCPNCRKYLASYEETVKLGKHAFDAEDEPLPADVPQQLIQAIQAARRQS